MVFSEVNCVAVMVDGICGTQTGRIGSLRKVLMVRIIVLVTVMMMVSRAMVMRMAAHMNMSTGCVIRTSFVSMPATSHCLIAEQGCYQ